MRTAFIASVITASLFFVGCQDQRCTSCDDDKPGPSRAALLSAKATEAKPTETKPTAGHDHGATESKAASDTKAATGHDHGAAGSKAASDTKAAAGHDHGAGDAKADTCKAPAALIAVMAPTAGNQTAGTVHFTQVPAGVRIVAKITGLTPGQKHAIHIHEFGDVSAPDGSATGGHYNPGGHPHGGPEHEHRHAGDLGNLTADAAGNAHYELVVKDLTLCCGKAPVIGRSVIIHAKEDDLSSQPAGNAGPRISQGVIGATK